MIDSLGKVTVAAAGTPARATANEDDPTARVGCQAISFQVLPGNTGLIYIGLSGMNVATMDRVLGVLPAPADPTSGPFSSYSASIPIGAAGLNAADFYIDSTVNGDGVVIGLTRG